MSDPALVALVEQLRSNAVLLVQMAAMETHDLTSGMYLEIAALERKAADALSRPVAAPPPKGEAHFCDGDRHVWAADGHFAPVPIGQLCACGSVRWPITEREAVAAPPEGTPRCATCKYADPWSPGLILCQFGVRVSRDHMTNPVEFGCTEHVAALFPHDGSRI